MKNTNNFIDVKVGDKLWSFELGECEVTNFSLDKSSDRTYAITAKNQYGHTLFYTFNGRLFVDSKHQSLFWSEPTIIAPEKPKSRVTKTIERWVNVYEDGCSTKAYTSKEEANKRAYYDRIACVKLTGTYVVEEDE